MLNMWTLRTWPSNFGAPRTGLRPWGETRPRSRASPPASRRRTCSAGQRRPPVPAVRRMLPPAHILAHRGLGNGHFRLLLPQPDPDAPCAVPPPVRRLTASFQNRLDERQRHSQLRTFTFQLLPLCRHCASQSPTHLPPMDSQSPRYRADRPGPMLVPPPDLLV